MNNSTKILKSKTDRLTYKFKIMPNQMKCTIVHDPKTTKSAAVLGVAVGHMEDPDDCHGLAHFLEHMLFMGDLCAAS